MERVVIQQGDLELVETNAIPKSAKKVKLQNRFTVLKGEGVNLHELVSDTLSTDVEVYQDGDTLYLKTNKKVNLVHSEHGTTSIDPNKILKRRIEREFSYEDMEARNTRD